MFTTLMIVTHPTTSAGNLLHSKIKEATKKYEQRNGFKTNLEENRKSSSEKKTQIVNIAILLNIFFSVVGTERLWSINVRAKLYKNYIGVYFFYCTQRKQNLVGAS